MPTRSISAPADAAPSTPGMLGLWLLLASELMLFAPLLLAYVYCRTHYPDGFAAGSRLSDYALGTCNTALLLTSSMTMALAVVASGRGDGGRATRALLLATAALGLAFLFIKGLEYRHDWTQALVPGLRFDTARPQADGVALFFLMYFGMTLLHALHLCAGIALLLWLAARPPTPPRRRMVPLAGLYWHFVDLVWIFLYPLLYLVGRAGGPP